MKHLSRQIFGTDPFDWRRLCLARVCVRLVLPYGLLTALVSLVSANAAHATCWAGGDRAARRLQAEVDVNPARALHSIDAEISVQRHDRSNPARLGWLLAVKTAALTNLVRYDEAEAAAREALSLAGKDPVLRAEIIDQYVSSLFVKPAPEVRRWLAELETLRKGLPTQSPAAICSANAESILMRALGDNEAAMRFGGDAYRAAKAARLEDQAAYIALNLSTLILISGDAQQADDLAKEAEDLARSKGETLNLVLAAFLRAQIAAHERPEFAAKEYLDAGRMSQAIGLSSAAAEQGACKAFLALGKLQDALNACGAAERHVEPGDKVARLLIGQLFGDIDLARHEPRIALDRYNDLLKQAQAPALGAMSDRIRQGRAQALAALGRYADAYADIMLVSQHVAARTDAQRARDLANTRARFGWDRQRLANAELARDLAVADARDQVRRMWLWTIASWGALLALMLAWVMITGKRHRRKLEALASEARDLARTKADLLSNMSHEIRSPLGSLTLAASRLAESPDIPAEGQQRAQRLGHAGERLIALLDDLLLFSRIDAQQVPVIPRSFMPAKLVSETVMLLEPKAQAVGAQLAIEIDPQAPLAIESDANRIGQIIVNLIENAIRHANATHITVILAPDSAEHCLFEVVDNGCGIEPDQQARLFQRFSQVDGSLASSDGSGLGLAICRGLAELLGGEIQLVSMPGKGTRMTLRLPTALPHGAGSMLHAA